MTLTIDPDITAPVRLRVSGTIGIREAIDLVDVLTLTAPEPAVIDFGEVDGVRADALRVLSAALRAERTGDRSVTVRNARPLVDLLLTIVGINDIGGELALVPDTPVAIAC